MVYLDFFLPPPHGLTNSISPVRELTCLFLICLSCFLLIVFILCVLEICPPESQHNRREEAECEKSDTSISQNCRGTGGDQERKTWRGRDERERGKEREHCSNMSFEATAVLAQPPVPADRRGMNKKRQTTNHTGCPP